MRKQPVPITMDKPSRSAAPAPVAPAPSVRTKDSGAPINIRVSRRVAIGLRMLAAAREKKLYEVVEYLYDRFAEEEAR